MDHLRKWDSQILITTVTHPSNKIDSETISLGQHNNLVRFRCKFTQLSKIFLITLILWKFLVKIHQFRATQQVSNSLKNFFYNLERNGQQVIFFLSEKWSSETNFSFPWKKVERKIFSTKFEFAILRTEADSIMPTWAEANLMKPESQLQNNKFTAL